MVVVAQLVRALVCGTRGRRFESGLPPHISKIVEGPVWMHSKVLAVRPKRRKSLNGFVCVRALRGVIFVIAFYL